MFTSMDTDNSGAITFDELKAGLKRYGSTMKESEIRDLMDAVSQPPLMPTWNWDMGLPDSFLLADPSGR